MLRKLVAVSGILALVVVIGCGGSVPSGPAVGSGNEPPVDATWISPGKVMVSNFHPGARAEYNLTIHNGNLFSSRFKIAYRYPDHVGEGYVEPPEVVQEWVIIADSSVVLQGRETRDILIVLEMPPEGVIEPKKWEFWIAVMEVNQPGDVRIEMATRWLVSMR